MTTTTSTCIATAAVLGGLSLGIASAANWPAWRGHGFDGVAEAGEYPVSFSPTEGILWKAELPGRGSSTPAVWEDAIFLTTGADGQDTVLRLDTAGREVWRRAFGPERGPKNRSATGSNPSPVTDGERVYVYFKSGVLAALDFAGEVVWRTNLQETYGADRLLWDLGTSPVLTRGAVVVAVMQDGGSYLAALDKQTGAVAWKTDRNIPAPAESNDAYTTPQVIQAGNGEFIVTWGADHLTGHDAETGAERWRCSGFNPDQRPNWRTIASAVAHEGMVLVPYGRGDRLAGVRLGGEHGVSTAGVAWDRQAAGSDVPTPAVRDGYAYVLNDRGTLSCIDVKTGEEQWAASLPRARDNYYASPVIAGDLIYCLRQDGTLFTGRIGNPGFELLAENNMNDRFVASPVPVNGQLLLRSADALYCIGTD
jgi:outer membrane protein assembly factor BamB